MMRPEDFREHLDQRPFEPFRIFLTDGETLDVTHPDQCIVARSTVYVGIPAKDAPGVAERVAHCSLVHIVRFEPLNGQRKRTRRTRKKRP